MLVRAVMEWAAGRGSAEVRLWVTEDNRPAERLYARHGFARTSETQPVVPGEPGRLEFAMSRRLARSPALGRRRRAAPKAAAGGGQSRQHQPGGGQHQRGRSGAEILEEEARGQGSERQGAKGGQ